MTMDKSLRSKSALSRARSVLTRAERIKILKDQERWTEEKGPFGLPKVRVRRLVIKAKKAAKAEDAAGAEKTAEAAPGKAAEAGGKGSDTAAKKK